jgi:hypothetical protein
MSFLKKLFGLGGSGGPSAPAPVPAVEYQGYRITPEPFQAEGQYQTAGTIAKEVEGEVKEHRFIRADRHPSHDSAVEFAISKAKQIIDEQGERIFR